MKGLPINIKTKTTKRGTSMPGSFVFCGHLLSFHADNGSKLLAIKGKIINKGVYDSKITK